MALSKTLRLHPGDQKRLEGQMEILSTAGVSVNKILRNSMRDTVTYTKKQVKKYDAIDTGRLQKNIKAVFTGPSKAELESEAIDPTTEKDYAPTVNSGLGVGKNSVARPYFDNGVKYFRNKFRNNITELFRLYTSLGAGSRNRAAIKQIGKR